MYQPAFFNTFTTPIGSSFTLSKPTNSTRSSVRTNPMASFNSFSTTHYNILTSPIISSPFVKAIIENRQADVFPQAIAIDMEIEGKSNDLMDVIVKFKRMEIVDEIDWEVL